MEAIPPVCFRFFFFLSCIKKLIYRDYHRINQQRQHEGISGAMELIETALIRGEKCQTTEKEERTQHVVTRDTELEAERVGM